jgi:hypothetical protein
MATSADGTGDTEMQNPDDDPGFDHNVVMYNFSKRVSSKFMTVFTGK